jgi:hypothetical protein
VKRDLERVDIPGEHDARERTWNTVRAAFETRERVTWPRRHARSLAVTAAAAAVVAAAFTPPGRSVVNSVRDAVGREKVGGIRPAHRELVRLPTSGRVLVDSPRGAWIVHADGSRRLLGPYHMPSWSAFGRYVAAVDASDTTLYALDTRGNVRWGKPRKQRLASPVWSYEGHRIAYFANDTIRVIWGNGEHDRGLGSADPSVAPVWKPRTHVVAWLGRDRDVRVMDADSGTRPTRVATNRRVIALAWVNGRVETIGRRIPGVAGTVIAAVVRANGETAVIARRGGHSAVYLGRRLLFSGAGRITGLTFSPDGRWLLVGWPSADQLVFIRVGATPKLVAVSNVARQFDPAARAPRFPRIGAWAG